MDDKSKALLATLPERPIEDERPMMTPLEAMTVLIQNADQWKSDTHQENTQYLEQVELAQAVATAMLNSALPVARYRCFVGVDFHKSPGSPIREDFTICSTTLTGIRAGLLGLREYKTEVHATLWEQRATGADMISGYQGPTKGKRYSLWVGSLNLETHPTAQ